MLFFRWLVLVSMCFSELKLRFVLASRFKCKKRQVPVVKTDGKSGREPLSGAIDLQQVGADDTANMCRLFGPKWPKQVGLMSLWPSSCAESKAMVGEYVYKYTHKYNIIYHNFLHIIITCK